MILGIKNTDIEAHRYNDQPIAGMSVNLDLNEVKIDNENVEIRFSYIVYYNEGVGMMKIDGTLYAKEDAKVAKEIAGAWKERKLPPEFAQAVLNSINYTCGTEGTFIARPLNLAPPIVPPKIDASSFKKK